MTRVVVVGDALLDRDWTGTADRLCPDSFGPVVDLHDHGTRLGGAALAAQAARATGCEVVLVTALASDAAAGDVRRLLAAVGVELCELTLDGPTPEKIRVRVGGQTAVRLDRGCVPIAAVGAAWRSRRVARGADAVLLADYGRGAVRAVLGAGFAADCPMVWDPHPRGRRPDHRLTLATPSAGEAATFLGTGGEPATSAVRLAERWGCEVVVTSGASGATLAARDGVHHVATQPRQGDPCGAGDWFAAGVTAALARGDHVRAAVAAGNRHAGSWVAGEWPPDGATAPARRLVATSGCFDVLHVGHLAMLRAARDLGDRLVVLLNSDRSVRLLKGPGRPVNTERDRRDMLLGLDAVDEVVLFDSATPCEVLDRLRPDVYVKGADYAAEDIPEREVLARWGGRLEFVPLVADRSTTRVLRLARCAG